MLEVYDELFEQFFLFHKDIFMGFFLSWEDEYRDLFLSAKETMFFFLASLLARLCLSIGKTFPTRWQNFAIGMAKVCQGQGKWLAKFLADRQ